MKARLILTAAATLLIAAGAAAASSMDDVIKRGLAVAETQSMMMARKLADSTDQLPRSFTRKGKFTTSNAKAWTSGFFPGVLWYLYEATGRDSLKYYADLYTRRLEDVQYVKNNHDVGFMLYCSYGNGYRLTKNEDYAKVMANGAKSLSTRFNPTVGCIRSWDRNPKVWHYAVIIDNMMNLELLTWASRHTGDKSFDRIARSHATKTMQCHFRPDNSCYHVVSYSPQTGEPELKVTYQGYADWSAWSRGQAWAIYGFTMMYRETGDKAYLKKAEEAARFVLDNRRMPDDGVPYWDFDAPDVPNAKRDASAAACMASAFIELSQYTDKELGRRCLDMAKKQLRTLTTPEYLAEPGTNGNFILKHSVGNFPKGGEVDVPLIYADYYYIEALLRLKALEDKK